MAARALIRPGFAGRLLPQREKGTTLNCDCRSSPSLGQMRALRELEQLDESIGDGARVIAGRDSQEQVRRGAILQLRADRVPSQGRGAGLERIEIGVVPSSDIAAVERHIGGVEDRDLDAARFYSLAGDVGRNRRIGGERRLLTVIPAANPERAASGAAVDR